MAGKWEPYERKIMVQRRERTAVLKGHARTEVIDVFRLRYQDASGVRCVETFPNITQARARRSEVEVAAQRGVLPDVAAGRKRFEDVWNYFEANRITKTGEVIKPSTFASYEVRWRTHIAPELGKRELGKLTRAGIEAFYVRLQQEYGVDARRKAQQIVHRLLDLAVRQGWLLRNPADNIGMPRANGATIRALTDAEVDAIADKIDPRYRALVILLAESGLRVGEAVALRVRNVNGSIYVEENAVEVDGERIVGTPKTEGSKRHVPVSPKLRAALKAHYDAAYANRFDPETLVFTTETGAPIRQTNFRAREFQPAARAARIKPVPRVHDLRHTWASNWLTRTGPNGERLSLWQVTKFGGWSSTVMVEKRYGHLRIDEAQAEVDLIMGAAT